MRRGFLLEAILSSPALSNSPINEVQHSRCQKRASGPRPAMSVGSAFALLIVRNRHLRTSSLARSAESGITVVYATIVHSHEVDTDKLCIGSTCVTQSEFLAMVAAANAAPSSGSGGAANDNSIASGARCERQRPGTVAVQHTAWRENLGALFTHKPSTQRAPSKTQTCTTSLATGRSD